MKFNEVINVLNNSNNNISLLYSNLKPADFNFIINRSISLLDKAISDENYIPESLDEKTINILNSIVDISIEDCLLEISKEDKESLKAIEVLLSNLNNLYKENLISPKKLRIFKALIKERKSFDDEFLILSTLYNKLSHKIFFDSASDNLSKKYYKEFENYLSKIGHDDSY